MRAPDLDRTASVVVDVPPTSTATDLHGELATVVTTVELLG